MRRVEMTQAQAKAVREQLTPEQEETAVAWATAVSCLHAGLEGLHGILDLEHPVPIPQCEPKRWATLRLDALWMSRALKTFLQSVEHSMPDPVRALCICNLSYQASDDPEGEGQDTPPADTPAVRA